MTVDHFGCLRTECILVFGGKSVFLFEFIGQGQSEFVLFAVRAEKSNNSLIFVCNVFEMFTDLRDRRDRQWLYFSAIRLKQRYVQL